MSETYDNDGLFGSNGVTLIVLILFLLFMGGGFGNWGGNGNNASVQGTLTRAELQDAISSQNLSNQINDGFSTNALAVNNGFANVQSSLCSGFSGVNAGIANLGYQMAQSCCDLKTELSNKITEVENMMNQNTIQDLRDQLQDAKNTNLATGLTAAQTIQTNNLENFIRSIINGNCSCGA